MEQDSLHKIITIEIEYSKLVKSWAEAQKVIDDTRQSIKNLKKEDADYYQKMALYKAVIREKTDAQRTIDETDQRASQERCATRWIR